MGALKTVFYFVFLCLFVAKFLRGERGCDGSHSRANTEGLTRLRGCRAENNYGQVSAGMDIDSSVIRHDHSTGITNSLLRTIFRRARAASSIVRGSVRSLSNSDFNDWLTPRNASTSVCIAVSCCAAT